MAMTDIMLRLSIFSQIRCQPTQLSSFPDGGPLCNPWTYVHDSMCGCMWCESEYVKVVFWLYFYPPNHACYGIRICLLTRVN